MLEPVTIPCQECGAELAGDSPELRLELTCDDEPIPTASSAGSGSSGQEPTVDRHSN